MEDTEKEQFQSSISHEPCVCAVLTDGRGGVPELIVVFVEQDQSPSRLTVTIKKHPSA
jgi:hypothetical protein